MEFYEFFADEKIREVSGIAFVDIRLVLICCCFIIKSFESRVHVIHGDVALLELGMDEEDYMHLTHEVNCPSQQYMSAGTW